MENNDVLTNDRVANQAHLRVVEVEARELSVSFGVNKCGVCFSGALHLVRKVSLRVSYFVTGSTRFYSLHSEDAYHSTTLLLKNFRAVYHSPTPTTPAHSATSQHRAEPKASLCSFAMRTDPL